MGYENSGRRPQPTALTVLRGNPSKKKLNKNEPRPPSGDITKPTRLSPGASAVWDELAPICMAMGTLTTADVRVFGSMCELQATLDVASAGKDGRSLLSLRHESDDEMEYTVVIDAVLKLERDTANSLRPYYALFGLEPVSRARIQVPKKGGAAEPVSKWAGALK